MMTASDEILRKLTWLLHLVCHPGQTMEDLRGGAGTGALIPHFSSSPRNRALYLCLVRPDYPSAPGHQQTDRLLRLVSAPDKWKPPFIPTPAP